MACLMLTLALHGCGTVEAPAAVGLATAAASTPCPDPAAVASLAGEWIFEESGFIYTLRLDRTGHGAYDWKKGRFVTSCLEGLHWRGRIIDNDTGRENVFAIQMNRDLTAGNGRMSETVNGNVDVQAMSRHFQLKRIVHSGHEPVSGGASAR